MSSLSGGGAAAGSNRSGRRLCRWRPYLVESSKEHSVTQEAISTSSVRAAFPTQKKKTKNSRNSTVSTRSRPWRRALAR